MKIILVILAVIVVADCGPWDKCGDPDFDGFGYEPTKKCGCCPWPCCCKCVEVSTGEEGVCQSVVDVAFILDFSGSISKSNSIKTKTFLKDLFSSFPDVGTDQLVASVTYSNNATVNWVFNDVETSSSGDLNNAIDGLYRQGRLTNTAEALQKTADQVLVPSAGDRPNAPNIALLLTDGQASLNRAAIPRTAQQLRMKALTLCIGIGKYINPVELDTICQGRVYNVDDYDSLTDILKETQKKICPEPEKEEKCFCCCTPEQFFGQGGSQYYQF